MAKKKSNSKTKYRTRTKTIRSYVGRAKAKAGGIINGLIAGVGGGLLNRYAPLGQWSQPVADIATGHFMKSETLETIGGRSIGIMLVNGGLNGSGTSGNTGNLVG